MVNYYRTPGGLYYKMASNGQRRRVSRAEFTQQGGADAPAAKPAIKRTKFEEECIEKAEALIKTVKAQNAAQIEKLKGREKGKFIANLVRETYLKAGEKDNYPECSDVYKKEKERKDTDKASRKASRKKRRRSRKPSKKTSKKRSKSRK